LQIESTLVEITAKHNTLPQNLVNWKKVFLSNVEIVIEPSKAVEKYKEIFLNHKIFHEILDYKDSMNVHQENIKLNHKKAKVSWMFYIRNFKKLSEVLGW